MKVRIAPSGPAPNYAPHYLAEDFGFFADEGLDVTSDTYAGPGSSWLADLLVDGRAEVALGGIWIPLAYEGRIAQLPAFAQVCSRNPQVLMARKPTDGFNWRDAYDKRVLLPLSSTSQWLFLEGALLEGGWQPSRISFIRDLEERTLTRLWRSGLGDYYLVTPPLSEELEDEGFFVAADFASQFGDVPWSVYYARRDFLELEDAPALRLARALERALTWLSEHSADDISYVLRIRFPGVTHDRLARAVAGIKSRGVWSTTVDIPREPYLRYQSMIRRYGLTDDLASFHRMVVDQDFGHVSGGFDIASVKEATDKKGGQQLGKTSHD